MWYPSLKLLHHPAQKESILIDGISSPRENNTLSSPADSVSHPGFSCYSWSSRCFCFLAATGFHWWQVLELDLCPALRQRIVQETIVSGDRTPAVQEELFLHFGTCSRSLLTMFVPRKLENGGFLLGQEVPDFDSCTLWSLMSSRLETLMNSPSKLSYVWSTTETA